MSCPCSSNPGALQPVGTGGPWYGPVPNASAPRPGDTRTGSAGNPSRLRLLEGLEAAISEKGYAATTIADVVRHARVSKRTFYEHFEDKEACFLASYAAASEETLRVIASAAASLGLPWEERLHAAARAYLHALEARPELTRTYLRTRTRRSAP